MIILRLKDFLPMCEMLFAIVQHVQQVRLWIQTVIKKIHQKEYLM